MPILNITVHFSNLRFRELYQFVDAVRAAGIDPSTAVSKLVDDDYEYSTTGFQLSVDATHFQGFLEPLTFDESRRLASTLDSLLTEEDPSRFFSELKAWRDRLWTFKPSPPR
ncbi:hypothetical protein GT755_01895 [Herbidospora sp. NEAU-GS84]|uniref:Uncharacterized protein n=1 Tax=Herbidospora solisilvae TaxID=2696284 RepID=A0A7C9N052_9ACTN|nr:hypothetical protein [Herbidospora solisilvae]NAS20434.1 hypothetical protein [Herbidospora solisilvae]